MGLISLKEMMPVRSDTNGRGKDFGRGDPFSDSAVSKDHRFHDFRYTVPLGFVGSKGHDQTDHEPPEAGNTDDNIDRERMIKGENITRIVVEDILGAFDQKAEKDGPVSAQEADKCGDKQRQDVLVQMVAFQGLLVVMVSREQHGSKNSPSRLSSHVAGQCVVQLNPIELQADVVDQERFFRGLNLKLHGGIAS